MRRQAALSARARAAAVVAARALEPMRRDERQDLRAPHVPRHTRRAGAAPRHAARERGGGGAKRQREGAGPGLAPDLCDIGR